MNLFAYHFAESEARYARRWFCLLAGRRELFKHWQEQQ